MYIKCIHLHTFRVQTSFTCCGVEAGYILITLCLTGVTTRCRIHSVGKSSLYFSGFPISLPFHLIIPANCSSISKQKMSLKVLRIAVALLASISLFGTVFATRFSEFAHRKGYGPNVKRRVLEQPRNSGNKNQKYRFLSKNTQRESMAREL